MCGIVGIVGREGVAPLLLDSLKRLEYRGYDSAGLATLQAGEITLCRAEGKLKNLAERLERHPLLGSIGIGHTRWATHGGPTEANAHPHSTGKVAVVHNGIIENYQELKNALLAKSHRFFSDTDTEVVAVLITDYIEQGMSVISACQAAFQQLKGAFALAVIFNDQPDLLVVARRGSPLAIGLGEGAMYVASDAIALAPLSRRLCYLDDGDWAVLHPDRFEIFDAHGTKVERPERFNKQQDILTGKGNYRHFMLKEIHEQPMVVADTLSSFIHPTLNHLSFSHIDMLLQANQLNMVACGSAYYAAMTAKYWFEELADLPVNVDIASEFRYRRPVFQPHGVTLVVSQSGETMDTLEAMRLGKKHGQQVMAIVNVPESSMAREAGSVIYTHAGPEIGVASTKAFTTQLLSLLALALVTAAAKGKITPAQLSDYTEQLRQLPALMQEYLSNTDNMVSIAQEISKANHALYLGRGSLYPLALEGALKLKEISYIHAEGYAAGEMKHGPIALIDEAMPVVVLAPKKGTEHFEKIASNIQEVSARGGKLLVISDAEGLQDVARFARWTITMPEIPEKLAIIAPILYTLPVQLLAYEIALVKGTDIDQPRNLAKSVTVE
ncbi:MAG: glutamine--fructose-6-phosphate transaminase (isomerizing) [Alphaproteobacteria bacterium]